MKVMVNFQLGKLNVKDEIINNDTSVGQRKNLSPQQESNSWPPKHRVGALSTDLWELMESEAILPSSYVTCVLHTARISNVDVIMNCDKWKWWVLVAQWIERPPGVREVMGSIPVGDSDFFFVPRSCLVDYFIFHTLSLCLKMMNVWESFIRNAE